MPTGMLQAAGPSPAAGGSRGELVALLTCGAHSEGQLCTRPSSLPPDCVSHRHVPVFILTIFSSVLHTLAENSTQIQGGGWRKQQYSSLWRYL